MPLNRGREARLKSEFTGFYPGLMPDTWMPIETLLQHVATLLHTRASEPGTITGERLIREEHFEFRGQSDRPAGLPIEHSRLSDASADPTKRGPGGV